MPCSTSTASSCAFADDGRLNAPWGLAVAPSEGFGPFNGALLVGDFGGKGRIAAYDIERGAFAAGPGDETQGSFGARRHA